MMTTSRLIYGFRWIALVALVASLPVQLTAQSYRVPVRARAAQAVNPQLVARAEQLTGDRFRVATATRMGVAVVAVNQPNPAVLAAIDQGFNELFAVARRHGYRNHGDEIATEQDRISQRAANRGKDLMY